MKYGRLETGQNTTITNQDGYLNFSDLSYPNGVWLSNLSSSLEIVSKEQVSSYLNNWTYDYCLAYTNSGATFNRVATSATVGCNFICFNSYAKVRGVKFYGSLTYPDAAPRTYKCKLWDMQNSIQLAEKDIIIESNGVFSCLFDEPINIVGSLVNIPLAATIWEISGSFYVELAGGSNILNDINTINGYNALILSRSAYGNGNSIPTTKTSAFIVDPIMG